MFCTLLVLEAGVCELVHHSVLDSDRSALSSKCKMFQEACNVLPALSRLCHQGATDSSLLSSSFSSCCWPSWAVCCTSCTRRAGSHVGAQESKICRFISFSLNELLNWLDDTMTQNPIIYTNAACFVALACCSVSPQH